MNIIKGFKLVFGFLVYLALGLALIYFATDFFPYDTVSDYIAGVRQRTNVRYGIYGVGILFIVLGFIFSRVQYAKMRKEKTIAFENPDGQVVVSLAAIEDYVRRIVKQLPQVKDLKSNVTASKRGVDVMTVATLFADANIPEVTEKIQAIIKSKLLEMLGIEESISVRVHVAKLISKNAKEETGSGEIKEMARHVPFRGLE